MPSGSRLDAEHQRFEVKGLTYEDEMPQAATKRKNEDENETRISSATKTKRRPGTHVSGFLPTN